MWKIWHLSLGGIKGDRPYEIFTLLVCPQYRRFMWIEITALDRVPVWGVLPVQVEGISLILNRQGTNVTCYRNACTHLEYPIDMGKVSNGTITCPFHKFQYELVSGKCLNAPADPLKSFPVKIEGDRVFVEIQ